MYNLFDNSDIYKFKKKLTEARKNKGFTQETLAEKIGVNRQSVANWERENCTTIPPLAQLLLICDSLETDPNYLLGVSNFPSNKIENISKEINLSYDNIEKLQNGSFTNTFLDYILSNKQFDNLIFNIRQLCYSSVNKYDLTEFLTESAIKKLKKVYKNFYNDTFMNMSQRNFSKYISQIFVYEVSQSFEQFAKGTFTNEGYNEFLLHSHNTTEASNEEKYAIAIDYLSQIGFEYEFNRKMKEISVDKIHRNMATLIEDFIATEIDKINSGIYIGYLDK